MAVLRPAAIAALVTILGSAALTAPTLDHALAGEQGSQARATGTCSERFPGDPCGEDLYYGASVEGGDPRPLEALTGQRLEIFRSYMGAETPARAFADRAAADLAAGRVPLISTKVPGTWAEVASGAQDTWLTARIEALASLPGPVWVAFHHEPRGDGRPADWVAMQQHVRQVIDEYADNLTLVGILNGWTFLENGGNPEAYYHPPGTGVDIMGFDSYNPWSETNEREWRSVDEVMSPGLAIQSWGYPTLLAETGVREDPDHPERAAAWLEDQFDYAVAHDFVAVSYFNSGANSPDGTWELSGERLTQFAENLGGAVVVDPCAGGCPSGSVNLQVQPDSSQQQGEPVTLTASVEPSEATGEVAFSADGEVLRTVAAEAGSATVTTSDLAVGAHDVVASFLPTGDWQGVTFTPSPALRYTIVHPTAAPTVTALAAYVSPGAVGFELTMTAHVSLGSPGDKVPSGSGTVRFYDSDVLLAQEDVSSDPVTTSVDATRAGEYELWAEFVPQDPRLMSTSQSMPVMVDVPESPTCERCDDPQSIVVAVPAGGLAISTPYTPDNPFDLGSMTLSPNGTSFAASALFPASGDQFTITDTRAGDLPWTASVQASSFDGVDGTISPSNASLTTVTPDYIAGNALNAASKPVEVFDLTSAAQTGAPYGATIDVLDGLGGGSHVLASAAAGAGSVRISGLLGLAAPTSTPAGLYVSTITFTIA